MYTKYIIHVMQEKSLHMEKIYIDCFVFYMQIYIASKRREHG